MDSDNTPYITNNPNLTKISWDKSVWFTDIDDTLIDTLTASTSGSIGIRDVLTRHCGNDLSLTIQAEFNRLYQLMVDGYRVKHEDNWKKIDGGKQSFEELLNTISSLQVQVEKDFGHTKKWSREIFIKVAADKFGVQLSPEIIHEAADAYWITLTEKVKIFPDAIEFSNIIAAHGKPLYLVTSSDARLTMQNDGQFTYNPEYSEALKRQRVELLRYRGLKFNTISIGDPEDKPHLDFFEKALKIAELDLGSKINVADSIMVGDSFGGDLQTPKEQMGFGIVVLRENHQAISIVNDSHQITVSKLTDIFHYID